MLNSEIGPLALQQAKKTDLSVREITSSELEDCVLRSLDFLDSTISPSGREYFEKWEAGWAENLEALHAATTHEQVRSAVEPKFVRQGGFIKIQGRWVKPRSATFERDFVHVLRVYLAETWFGGTTKVVEFGAGTGHNLVHLAQLLPGATFKGLDWSRNAVHIINELGETLGQKISGQEFDLFLPHGSNPPADGETSDNSGPLVALTVGALEQLGKNYHAFLNYLLELAPSLIVHLETAYELYGDDHVADVFSKKYIEKRSWLQGYFACLNELEAGGEIEILKQTKTIGSFHHEGYTMTIWRKIR